MKEFISREVTPDEMSMLTQFIKTFRGSLDPRTWAGLVLEEAKEVEVAFREEGKDQWLKELADLRYVTVGGAIVSNGFVEFLVQDDDKMLENIREADRILGEVLSSDTQLIPIEILEEALRRVHESNMSKLDEDGNPILRESDGKVLKGPNYMPPNMADLAEMI